MAIPGHLKVLACIDGLITMQFSSHPTIRLIQDFLEQSYPSLKGTTRDFVTKSRRPFVRFFVEEEDISNLSIDEPLPAKVVDGTEVFYIVGAIAGGEI